MYGSKSKICLCDCDNCSEETSLQRGSDLLKEGAKIDRGFSAALNVDYVVKADTSRLSRAGSKDVLDSVVSLQYLPRSVQKTGKSKLSWRQDFLIHVYF